MLVQCSAHGVPQPATIVPAGGGIDVTWTTPQRRVAPGQSVVFYDPSDQVDLRRRARRQLSNAAGSPPDDRRSADREVAPAGGQKRVAGARRAGEEGGEVEHPSSRLLPGRGEECRHRELAVPTSMALPVAVP